MSIDLQRESERLNGVILELSAKTRSELTDVNKRIDELNELLQMKEMKTDRSENASYQIARDERDMKTKIRGLLQKRLSILEAEAGVYTPTGIITQGTTVLLKLLSIEAKPVKEETSFIIKLVDHALSSAKFGLVAIDSKVGEALMSRRAGDLIEVRTSKGYVRYSIERIY